MSVRFSRGRISPKCACSSRRGSALLVVLGMLTFMIISGVAFSLFMRSSRMSSSFTRRVSSTRQLAKAALAEAIDQIDRSIGNDPHPNVRQSSANDCNYWLGRVLVTPYAYLDKNGDEKIRKPADIVSSIESSLNKSVTAQDIEDGIAASTVPVLSVEALAYLPPCLVNEARFFGQRTPSAAWQTFDFDAGRYAFVALDVSDYFDVNRLIADEPRSSNPSRRVTFGHLFEDAEHTSAPSGSSAWETFMDKFRKVNDDGSFDVGTLVPLVSLADFNLALGGSEYGAVKSPFYEAFKQGGKGCDNFYQASPNTDEFDEFAELTFVTDSLEAPVPEAEKKTSSGTTVLNLDGNGNPYDDDTNQPFPESYLSTPQSGRNLLQVAQVYNNRPGGKQLTDGGVPSITMFHLSDYLDHDRIPISLGIPSVEPVPMICGVKPSITSPVSIGLVMVPDTDVDVSGTRNQTDMVVKRTIHWRVDPSSLNGLLGGVNVLVAYPFLNRGSTSKGPETGVFSLDGKVQIFLSMKANPMCLRIGTPSADVLHWGNGNPGAADLPGNPQLFNSVLNLPLKDTPIAFGAISKPEDYVQPFSLTMDLSSCATAIQTSLANLDVLRVTYQWTQHMTPSATPGGTPTYDNLFTGQIPDKTAANAGVTLLTSGTDAPDADWLPLGPNGQTDRGFLKNVTDATVAQNIDFVLNFVPTIRVKSSEGVHDMVPASLDDDAVANSVNNAGLFYNEFNNGLSTPLLLFRADFQVNPQTSVSAPLALSISPSNGIMVDDPRYNHAPENWQELTTFTPAGWYAAQSSGQIDAGKSKFLRDGDIFMATSGQDYLQSVYELAFLPRLADLTAGGSTTRGFLGTYWGKSCNQLCPSGRTPPDAGLMWKTYDPLGRIVDDNVDGFENIGLDNLGRGLRVNPFSDSTNVIMAAFANTPFDWRAASEDPNRNAAANKDVKAFNEAYAWNEYPSSKAEKISWSALSAVAREFMAEVRSSAVSGGGDWRDALSDLFDCEAQYDTPDYLCGVRLSDYLPAGGGANAPIYSVDKKFLYGYWRNCFSARQQLFLVFFRAEPMMMGGGVGGVTPPQLGARGVALVWRDPNRTSGSACGYQRISNNSLSQNSNNSELKIDTGYRPHQTRVLFYRQFE